MKRIILSLAVLIAAGFSSLSCAGEQKQKTKFTAEGGYFSCSLPKGWSKMPESGQSQEEKKIYGLDLIGPAGTPPLPSPSITVKYYADNNVLYGTVKDFIAFNSRPLDGLKKEGDVYGPLQNSLLNNRKAVKFERKSYDYVLPRKVTNEKFTVYELFVLVPAKGGFYLLKYYSPLKQATTYLPVFEAIQKSFVPKIN